MDVGKIEQAVRTVSDQAAFIKELLGEGLDWPVERGITKVEDIAYGWSKDDLQIDSLEKQFVDGQIWQIQPLEPGRKQPWGIFLLEFTKPDVFTSGRGITGPLRRILRRLVPKRRQQPNHAVWERRSLLFICTHNYEHFSVAYFKEPPEGTKTAPLAIFGWGPDIPSRTAVEFNLPALDWPDSSVSPDQWVSNWASAFDVEKVTAKFFKEYAAVFAGVEAQMPKSLAKDEERRLYTQMLMNRLMFLRFIERKGWLKLGQNPNYLQELFTSTAPRASFYKTRLRRLFFEGLALKEHTAGDVIGDVPFLNGGLFEEDPLDKKVEDIPNAAFELVLGKDGIFYRYNFTVEESTPLDIQVAVDPEMLGKVFEELVTGRHETGSYYTPRPVVSFMCREALKGYLADKTSATPEAVAKLVDKHDVAGLSETDARGVIDALDNLKAVDPACGSGAYLLGLLQEMVVLYRLLYSEKLTRDSRSLYELKLRIISNNLYGVDIDPFATNIAMLRLWLSIAVDSDQPVPLPNLDFKIETGDSLLGPCREFQKDFSAYLLERRAERLIQKKDGYLRAYGRKKQELYEYIRKEEEDIAGECQLQYGKGVIAWPVHFAEVFFADQEKTEATFKGEFGFIADQGKQKAFKQTLDSKQRGFDVVLANPPYVRQELIKEQKAELSSIFSSVFDGRADLYCYFYRRGFDLLKPGGMLVFISSNKWFRAKYGGKLRNYVATKTRVFSITDFGELPVFQAGATFPMIFVAQKNTPLGTPVFTQVQSLRPPYPNVLALVTELGKPLPPNAISGSTWHLSDSESADRIQKMEAAGTPLQHYARATIYSGIKSGYNAAFLLDEATRCELLAADRSSAQVIKRFARGDDVRKWHIRDGHEYIIYTPPGTDIDRYPAIKKHLSRFRDRLSARAVQQPWWELQQAQNRPGVWTGPKIVFPDIAKEPRFTFDTTGIYLDMTAFILPSEDLFLLGVLNSCPVWDYLCQIAAVLGDANKGGRMRLKRQYVERIPVPTADAAEQKKIASLVKECLELGGRGCRSQEREIDDCVAVLYGL